MGHVWGPQFVNMLFCHVEGHNLLTWIGGLVVRGFQFAKRISVNEPVVWAIPTAWPSAGQTVKYRNRVRGLVVCEVCLSWWYSCCRLRSRYSIQLRAPHARCNGVYSHENITKHNEMQATIMFSEVFWWSSLVLHRRKLKPFCHKGVLLQNLTIIFVAQRL